MSKNRILLLLLAVWACYPYSRASAVIPMYVFDRELADMPVVVVAHWLKSPFHPTEHGVDWTEIEIEGSIRGGLAPGRYKVLRSFSVAWTKEGRHPESIDSEQTLPEVEDVTKSSLWFLSYRKGMSPDLPQHYLYLWSGREIVPLALQRYYETLLQPDRDKRIAELLQAPDEMTVMRSLEYISGIPWTWSDFGDWKQIARGFAELGKPGHPLYGHAQAVKGLLQRKEPTIRRMAAAVYIWLTADRGVMRNLLADKDPEVRKIARIALHSMSKPGPKP